MDEALFGGRLRKIKCVMIPCLLFSGMGLCYNQGENKICGNSTHILPVGDVVYCT